MLQYSPTAGVLITLTKRLKLESRPLTSAVCNLKLDKHPKIRPQMRKIESTELKRGKRGTRWKHVTPAVCRRGIGPLLTFLRASAFEVTTQQLSLPETFKRNETGEISHIKYTPSTIIRPNPSSSSFNNSKTPTSGAKAPPFP